MRQQAALVTAALNSVPTRKRIELQQKLASLRWEFEKWRARTEENQELQKHHTQVRAVTGILEMLAGAVDEALKGTLPDDRVLAESVTIELRILELHRMWEFFRSKLALRYVPWFEDYLLAADEFAWACYEPCLRFANREIGREPPLVFLNGGSSPFTVPRGAAYAAEDVPGETMRTEQFEEALQRIPIPVIGIPWFQVKHLPDALVIGHEVGHDVERDLNLAPALASLLDATLAADTVPDERRRAWHAWTREVFADVYGVLAGGPAFVEVVIDFLVGDPSAIAREWQGDPSWGLYPTSTLRVLLACAVLEQCGFAGDTVGPLRSRWTALYDRHALTEFEPDVPRVARALVNGPYAELRDKPLTELLSFSPSDYAAASKAADRAGRGRDLSTTDVRKLIAAARIAYDTEPETYLAKDVAQRVVTKIRAAQKAGTRRRLKTLDAQIDRAARDRSAAAQLLGLMEAAHGGGQETNGGGADEQALEG
jgi:hypothetical protein